MDDCEAFYRQLHKACGAALDESFNGERSQLLRIGHSFISELEVWLSVLDGRPEAQVLEAAAKEYGFALLALSMGQYRQAFTSLRLFFELCLCAILYSANELHLRTWLKGARDLNWQSIVNLDDGIFSKQFISVFFEALTDNGRQYQAIAAKVYRECSEFVHGNWVTNEKLPKQLEFREDIFKAWHATSKSMRLVASFALTMRYLPMVTDKERSKLEDFATRDFGALPAVSAIYSKAKS